MNQPDRLREATQLRPRRTGEIIDAAITVWGKHFKVLTVLAAALVLPFQVVSALIAVSVKPTLLDSFQQWQKDLTADSSAKPHFTGKQIAAMSGSGIVQFIATFLLTAALTAFLADVYLGRKPDRRRSIRAAIRRGPIMLLSSILGILAGALALLPAVGLAVAGLVAPSLLALLAAFPVWIWFFIRISAGGPAVVLEHAGPIKALRRSFGLTKGRWWPIVGITFLSLLIAGIPNAMISAAVKGVLSLAGGNNAGFDFVWTAISQTVAAAITAPVSAAIAVILYIDLRIRREGFDLEQLAAANVASA